jgi:ketosteroid isomerase-like protein
MSQDRVEIVRAQFEATNRRDFAAAMDAYDENVVLVVKGLFPSGTFLGREAVGGWFGDSTTRQHGGTGIGLTIARELVELLMAPALIDGC